MRWSIRRDLGLQLLALYLLFLVPIFLGFLVFDQIVSQRLEGAVKASDLALARAIAQETNTAMDQSLQAVARLSEIDAVINYQTLDMGQIFATVYASRPDVNLVYRLDESGIMRFHYPTGPGSTVNQDFSFREYFQRAKTTHQPLLSFGRISPTTEQPVTTAVMPIWDKEGIFNGVVATNIKLQSLSTTLASIASEQRSEEAVDLFIIDAAGKIIAHPNSDYLLIQADENMPDIIEAVLSGGSGNLIELNQSGVETLYSYIPISSVGWGVVVSRPTATAFATARDIHRVALVAIGGLLGFGLLFWFALSRQVIRPLERLAAFSRSIGKDEPIDEHQKAALDIISERPDQIGYLIQSLRRMEQSIDARLKELSTLLQTSAAVVSSLDTEVVLNSILEQLEHLLGIRMCAIVAMEQSQDIFRAQASRGLSKRYVEHIAISPSEPLSTTMRAIRSGKPIQVSDTEKDESFAAMRPRARSEGYRSILAVPLNTQHAPPSVLLVYRPDPHIFSEREIDLLSSFANHATMAIENAALYARSDLRLREQTRRLEALIQSLLDGLVLEDLNERVIYANRRICELIDMPMEQIVNAPVSNFTERLLARTPVRERERIRAEVAAAMEAQGPRRLEIPVRSPQARYYRLQVFDVTATDGTLIGRGQILRDISQNKEIERMRSSLISTVSHELRTPLAAIKGYASTLLADDVDWDIVSQQEFLQIISDETDRLSKLVNDLLDMSRIEAGNLDVSRVECRLTELIDRAARMAHPSLDGRLDIVIPPDLPTIFVDAQRIEAVLRNLIENAAKYSEIGTPIRISSEVQSGKLIVRVSDEGPGIPAEHSEKVFESFYRAGDNLTQPAPGAGLGLAICKGFISAHGGEIWLEPTTKGTRVAFSIPLSPSVSSGAKIQKERTQERTW
jgi:signal transduction histidine kinase